MTLADYLREAARRPFVWGTSDCCTFAADWVLAATGIDPMAGLRGRYHDEASADALLRPFGLGLTFIREMTTSGFRRASEPAIGDVGAIKLVADSGHKCAILTPDGWACKSHRGIVWHDEAMHHVIAFRVIRG